MAQPPARPVKLPAPTRLDRLINYVAPRWGLKRAAARLQFQVSTNFYRGADYSRLLSGWITEPQAMGLVNPFYWERETLQVRSQELERNNAVAASIIDTLVTNVIGQGLQPQSRMRALELGVSKDEAMDYRRQAQNIFDRWQKNADACSPNNFAVVQSLAFRKIVVDGEVVVNLPMPKRPWVGPLCRAVELIEANRLGTPLGRQNVFDGIEMDPETKLPLAYWLRRANITTGNYEVPHFEWYQIPARDSRGRPLLLHPFLLKRPGQLRGVPFLTPALGLFKHLGDTYNAMVVAAKMAACVAMVITSNNPLGDTLQAQSVAQNEPSGASPYQAEGGNLERWEPAQIIRLPNGDSVTVVDPKGVHEAFASIMESGFRMAGASQNMSYELVMKDFSKTNYSSARAALLENRRWFMFLRSWFGSIFNQPIWELLLEEAYLTGEFQVPNFYAHKEEYCRCQWMGGGWGWVDPVKEVGASIAAIAFGLSTHAKELAGQGEDWEETFEQLVQEKQYAAALGLTFVLPKSSTAAGELKEAQAPSDTAEKEAGAEAAAQIPAGVLLDFLARLEALSPSAKEE